MILTKQEDTVKELALFPHQLQFIIIKIEHEINVNVVTKIFYSYSSLD